MHIHASEIVQERKLGRGEKERAHLFGRPIVKSFTMMLQSMFHIGERANCEWFKMRNRKRSQKQCNIPRVGMSAV